MAHAALRAADALTLSYTKFKTRRVRTILTLISTSILSMVLVVFSSVLTGTMAVANDTPQSALTDLHLAETFAVVGGGSQAPDLRDPVGPPPPVADTVNRFKDQEKHTAGLSDVYVETNADPEVGAEASLDLVKVPVAHVQQQENNFIVNTQFASARSTRLVQPFLSSGQTLQWKSGDPLPILVSTEAINDAFGDELGKIKNTGKRVERREAIENSLVGKTGTLTLKGGASVKAGVIEGSTETGSPDATAERRPSVKVTNLSVKIVGFTPDPNGIISGSYSSPSAFTLPYEVVQQNPATAGMFNAVSWLFPSFDTVKHRNAYVDRSHDNARIYADIVESNKYYFKFLDRIYNIAVIVMLVLMAIPMAATMSKILSDSQRETGVFRAIGARNRNILGIYGLYTLQLVVLAFVMSLVVGFGIAALIDARWADDMQRGITDVSDSVIPVNLVRVNPEHLGTIFLGLLAGSALGALFPLIRSLRRDPIKSLREE